MIEKIRERRFRESAFRASGAASGLRLWLPREGTWVPDLPEFRQALEPFCVLGRIRSLSRSLALSLRSRSAAPAPGPALSRCSGGGSAAAGARVHWVVGHSSSVD